MIFKLRLDRFNYMHFNLSPTEIKEKLGDMFILDDADEWAGLWKPLNGEFFDGSDKGNVITLPDITLWSTDEIVCNEKAYAAIKEQLESYGEWLPIEIEGVSYWLLHVTKKTGMDFVDVNQSERIVDRVGDIDVSKLTFHSEKVKDSLILKTEYNNYRNIYCTDAFKSLIETNDLKGLIFSEDMTNSPY